HDEALHAITGHLSSWLAHQPRARSTDRPFVRAELPTELELTIKKSAPYGVRTSPHHELALGFTLPTPHHPSPPPMADGRTCQQCTDIGEARWIPALRLLPPGEDLIDGLGSILARLEDSGVDVQDRFTTLWTFDVEARQPGEVVPRAQVALEVQGDH